MAFQPRTRAAIRDSLLASWSSRYSAIGLQLLTIPGSDAYILADGLATSALELFEYQALNVTKDFLPDTASDESVKHHGVVEGLPQKLATPAVETVTISGTASATVTFGSSVLVYNGVSYGAFTDPNTDLSIPSVTLSGGGTASVNCTALTPGASTTLPATTILTWSSTPTNASNTAMVSAIAVPGTDDELISAYAARIIAKRQEHPASGNRSDWKSWAEAVKSIDTAFIYPLWDQTYGTGTRGAVTVVVVGPAQGSGSTNTRIFSGSTETNRVIGYIEGTNDISGTAGSFTQLRPVTIPAGSYAVLPAIEVIKDITIVLTMASDAPFPWTSPASYTVTAYNGSTKEITLSADPAAAATGHTIAVRDTGVRGKYTYGKIIAVNHSTNKITMESTFSPSVVDTTASGRVRPAPPSATSIRDAIFGYIDLLTPGDTSPACRWPIIDSTHPSILYRPAIVAAAISKAGGSVLSASVTTPSSDQTPAPRELYALGELILSP